MRLDQPTRDTKAQLKKTSQGVRQAAVDLASEDTPEAEAITELGDRVARYLTDSRAIRLPTKKAGTDRLRKAAQANGNGNGSSPVAPVVPNA